MPVTHIQMQIVMFKKKVQNKDTTDTCNILFLSNVDCYLELLVNEGNLSTYSLLNRAAKFCSVVIEVKEFFRRKAENNEILHDRVHVGQGLRSCGYRELDLILLNTGHTDRGLSSRRPFTQASPNLIQL